MLLALASAAHAQVQAAEPKKMAPAELTPQAEKPVYPIGALYLQYADLVEGVPDLSTLTALTVPLVRAPDGFTAPAKGAGETQPVSLNRPDGTPAEPFTDSAVRAIDQVIAEELGRRGIVGVLVRPHPEDIGANTGRDLRPPGVTALRIVVLVSRVVEEHTIASGWRVPEDERVDNPAHERIRRNSPVQPGERVDKQALEDYAARLNRLPGRWVDVAVGPSAQPSGTRLDYLVAEGRPYTAYFQASDTGTNETSKWRERFGFTHNQVTGRDDVLQLDYVTGDFSDVNAVFGSYGSPIPFPWLEADRLRAQLNGAWSNYDASAVGIESGHFEGSQWDVGGRMTANVYQHRDLFVDLFTGASFTHYDADSDIGGFVTHGSTDFFFPEVGAVLERRTEISRLFASISGDFNVPSIAGTRKSDLTGQQMGRSDVTETDVKILRFDSAVSFYLAPFFFPAKEPDASLPASALANEIFLSFRGQYTKDRLIPAQEMVAGGLETVRGYPQSWLASDTLYLGRAEYRLHVPRLFPVHEPYELPWLGRFRAAPDRLAGGRPDWDLILRAFYDWGLAEVNGRIDKNEQENSTLGGTGVGAELQLPGSLVLRFDYGLALNRVNGLSKFHDTFSFSFALIH